MPLLKVPVDGDELHLLRIPEDGIEMAQQHRDDVARDDLVPYREALACARQVREIALHLDKTLVLGGGGLFSGPLDQLLRRLDTLVALDVLQRVLRRLDGVRDGLASVRLWIEAADQHAGDVAPWAGGPGQLLHGGDA